MSVLTDYLISIANAIRAKKGTVEIINAQDFASEIESIPTGGDDPIQNSGGKYLVRVVDYDGKILKEDYLNSGDVFTMPNPPIHDRLSFDYWSSPIDIIDNSIIVPNYDVIMGPIYKTNTGVSEFDIVVSPTSGLTINFKITGEKDWGDGTIDSETTHTYTSAGNYTILMDIDNIDTSSGNIMAQNRDVVLKQVLLASRVTTIGNYAFYYLFGLEKISLPSDIISMGQYAFNYCYSLQTVILPNVSNNTYANSYIFANCGKLENVVIPKGWDFSFGTHQFNYCDNLEYVTLPASDGTAISSYCFSYANGIYVINILGDIKSISSNAFQTLYCAKEIRFIGCTSVPPLNNSTYFGSLSKNCRIIVPDNLYNSWKTATNWTTYASQIYKLSEVQ